MKQNRNCSEGLTLLVRVNSMDTKKLSATAEQNVLKYIRIVFVCTALQLSACVQSAGSSLCDAEVDQLTRQKTDFLVKQFWTENFGPIQSQNYSYGNQLDSIVLCGSVAKAIYSPKPLKGAIGSTIEYDVDMVTGHVKENFLNE